MGTIVKQAEGKSRSSRTSTAALSSADPVSKIRETGPIDPLTEIFALIRDPVNKYEVHVRSNVTLEQIEGITPKPIWKLAEQMFNTMLDRATKLGRDEVLIEINTTKEGGGVKKLIPLFIHMINLMGKQATANGSPYTVRAYWLVALPGDPRFEMTKGMHNMQQGVNAPGTRFTEEDKATHKQLAIDTFNGMKEIKFFQEATKFLIDDFQLAYMIELLSQYKSDHEIEIFVRNHINTDAKQMATPGTVQHVIKEHLHKTCGVSLKTKAYICHPVDGFAPDDAQNVVWIPPLLEMLGDVDGPQTKIQQLKELDWVDGQIVKQNRLRQEMWAKRFTKQYGKNWSRNMVHVDDQAPIDRDRKFDLIYARFDYAKVQWLNMEFKKRVVDLMHKTGAPEELIPATLIMGNGANDDTDTAEVLDRMFWIKHTAYADYEKYITIARLDHNPRAENALLRMCFFLIHLARAEGFEHEPSAAAIKENSEGEEGYGNIPSIVANAGGLKLQVEEDVNGHLIDHIQDIVDDHVHIPYVPDGSKLDHELNRVVKSYVNYLTNPKKYTALKKSTHDMAQKYHKIEFGPGANFVRLFRVLLGDIGQDPAANWLMQDILAKYDLSLESTKLR